MHSLDRRFTMFGVLMLAGVLTLSGCATKKFVRQEVGALEPKIAEVSNANKENGERIDAVDRRATQGIQNAQNAAQAADTKATQAGQAASAADTKATQAGQAAQAADTKASQGLQGVQAANNRINTIETRVASLDTYTAGQPQAIMFKVNSAKLDKEGMEALDSLAGQVSGQRSGYLVEIQGFTSSEGGESYNLNLSQRRAESVMRYLVGKNVPLYRISIVGLGAVDPVGDNKTRAGREQNRRVEVRLLKSGGSSATN